MCPNEKQPFFFSLYLTPLNIGLFVPAASLTIGFVYQSQKDSQPDIDTMLKDQQTM